ncbi:Tc toxin subunit A [Mycetohabitans rhizoxinica]|uniref:Virulence plasmid A protein n=1 Tax=Mycetohabitans rhizoxinica TaxID=412963 RepID=A0ABZ2PS58_9BURK
MNDTTVSVPSSDELPERGEQGATDTQAAPSLGPVKEVASSRLLQQLAPEHGVKAQHTDLSLQSVLEQTGFRSVFDIVAKPKRTFMGVLGAQWRGDTERVYDNALRYAVQIARIYREHAVTRPKREPGQATRGLVDEGPFYADQFQENWFEFCESGALEAWDAPPAYLYDIYKFAQKLESEHAESGGGRIPLDLRRPDLKDLRIDHASTYEVVPALAIVNRVLTALVDAYKEDTEDQEKTVYQLLAQRHHPFRFPYEFAHHQTMLGLAELKAPLGTLIYRLQRMLPINIQTIDDSSALGYALPALSQLSPAQQTILTQPPFFAHLYFVTDSTSEPWRGPGTHARLDWTSADEHYYVVTPGQSSVAGPDEMSKQSDGDGDTWIEFDIESKEGGSLRVKLLANKVIRGIKRYPMNAYREHAMQPVFFLLHPYGAENHNDQSLPEDGQTYTGSFLIDVRNRNEVTPGTDHFLRWKIGFVHNSETPGTWRLSESQQQFFSRYYGISINDSEAQVLKSLPIFLQQTDLEDNALNALLARGSFSPAVSPNALPLNSILLDGELRPARSYPFPHHYGAVYVNGTGVLNDEQDFYSASVDVETVTLENETRQFLINTSLDRFDRLQRMIRLQRWTGQSFAELDTLIVAAMRAEGEANLSLETNLNTVRVLGAFRYFHEKYSVEADEFAAFLYNLSPYAPAGRENLFDRVFNTPQLLEVPLVADGGDISDDSDDPASRQMMMQICAALGLAPTPESYGRAAGIARELCPGHHWKRTLYVLSIIYRQARIARMFGLTIEDCLALLELLGGEEYVKLIASGRITARASSLSEDKRFHKAALSDEKGVDALDVLMQLDWAVDWLRDAKLTIAQVQQYLGRKTAAPIATTAVAQMIERMTQGVKSSAVTAATLDGLNLPRYDKSDRPIDWMEVITSEISEMGALVDNNGLVKAYARPYGEPVDASLRQRVESVVNSLTLAEQDKDEAAESLTAALAGAQSQQSALVEAELNQLIGLPYEMAESVLAWSGDTIYALLAATHDEGQRAAGAVNEDDVSETYLALLGKVLRHSKAALELRLFSTSLHALTSQSAWLDGRPDALHLSDLSTLYLLQRYQAWLPDVAGGEDAVLRYFALANPEEAKNNEEWLCACHRALADLLGWTLADVEAVTRRLPQQVARSFADVEWLLRIDAQAQRTNLSIAALLALSGMHAASDARDWQQAGQWAMAAQRAQSSPAAAQR